jgi:tetratricopeptide (TPR) repeat protein
MTMVPMKSVAAARGWLIFLVLVTSIVGPENASAAQTTRTEVLSVGVAKPLIAAQVAIRQNHWDAALESIRQAQTAAHLTAKDKYNIDALLGYVLYRQNKYKQAAAVYERLVESPLMPTAQVSERTKAIAEMYFKMGDYPRTAKWAKAFLGRHPDEPQVATMLGDAYFRMDDYKNAVATMTAIVADAEHDRRIPKESWLRIIEDSYYRLEDVRGMESALVPLVG